MKKIFTLFIIVFVLGCSKNSTSQMELSFSLIGQDNLYCVGTEGITKSNLIIKDSSSWNNIMAKMNLQNNQTDKFTETSVDFNQYIIVAIFDKVYGNGGHTIDVTSITENESNIIIKVENLSKGALINVVTQPYHIVKILKTDKNIVFE